MKFKKAGRYALLLSIRLTKLLCFFLCCTLLFFIVSPIQSSTFAYATTGGMAEGYYTFSSRIELFGKVFILDTNIIHPIIDKAKDHLSANNLYISPPANTCLNFLAETFEAVVNRIATSLPLPIEYSGSASEA